MSVITKLDEFIATKPATAPTKPAPGVAPSPSKPATPTPAPKKPTPIPTKKPSVQPDPKMKAEDVVKAFFEVLKTHKGKIKFDLTKLKKKYD